jgi:hypothetical protein
VGQIVSGKQRIAVGATTPIAGAPRRTANRYSSARFAIGKGTPSVKRGGKEGKTLLADMALIRNHFGVNQSDALRLSLHLTAQAIRKNRALPEVE